MWLLATSVARRRSRSKGRYIHGFFFHLSGTTSTWNLKASTRKMEAPQAGLDFNTPKKKSCDKSTFHPPAQLPVPSGSCLVPYQRSRIRGSCCINYVHRQRPIMQEQKACFGWRPRKAVAVASMQIVAHTTGLISRAKPRGIFQVVSHGNTTPTLIFHMLPLQSTTSNGHDQVWGLHAGLLFNLLPVRSQVTLHRQDAEGTGASMSLWHACTVLRNRPPSGPSS